MSSKGRIKFYKRLDVRMALWYTVTFLTMIILIFGFLDYRFRRNLLKQIDRMLADEVKEIINVIRNNPETLNDELREYEKVASNQILPHRFPVARSKGEDHFFLLSFTGSCFSQSFSRSQ